jgi:hypothetical protein
LLTTPLPACLPGPPPLSPEAFGQHPNAEISYLVEDARALLGGLAKMTPRGGGGGGGGGGALRREEVVAAIAADLLDQVGGVDAAPAACQRAPCARSIRCFRN